MLNKNQFEKKYFKFSGVDNSTFSKYIESDLDIGYLNKIVKFLNKQDIIHIYPFKTLVVDKESALVDMQFNILSNNNKVNYYIIIYDSNKKDFNLHIKMNEIDNFNPYHKFLFISKNELNCDLYLDLLKTFFEKESINYN